MAGWRPEDTAIALLLAQNPQHRVRLWSARAENGRILQERRENVRLLPGIPIPSSVELTLDVAEAVADADLWIAAVPTVYLRATLERIAGEVRPNAPVVSLAKGVENTTFLRPTEILTQVLGVEQTAVLCGPSHAEEMSRGMPTSVVAASLDMQLARWIQQRFSTDRFRVYTNLDRSTRSWAARGRISSALRRESATASALATTPSRRLMTCVGLVEDDAATRRRGWARSCRLFWDWRAWAIS